MGKDLDGKTIFLIIIIVVLVGAAGYLTYLISNNENPLVLLNSRASEAEADPLLAQAATPTPTVSFTSTSPTPTKAVGANTTPGVTGTVTPTRAAGSLSPTSMTTPTPSTLPATGGGAVYVTATPSPIGSLPVAGFGDFLKPAAIGGGILIIAALLL
ncbi:hypothetical protein KBD81_06175 [Candidatus Woesebacteria bacterium]|nr:hypothetical protein [Candidatus Woesebacteria bacterium]